MKYFSYTAIALSTCLLLLSGCQSEPAQQHDAKPAATTQHQTVPAPIQADSKEWSDKGLEAYQQFHYDEAIAAYDKAIALDARNYEALSGKGVALAMKGNENGTKGDVTAGIALIQKALSIAPDDIASFYNLALAYKINGQYDDAITWFQKVIAKDPKNTWSYYGIATIYGDQGKAKEAVEYLRKAAALDKNAVLDAARTQSHFDKVRNDEAFKSLVNS